MGGLIINHNLMAMTASRNLTSTYGKLGVSINRLSSGLRITSSKDDAAGLAVRELMRSDIAVLNQGIRNANDAIAMLQTMDGAASVIDEKLIRMKELAEQASTGTYSSDQRSIMNDEFDAMRDEIERIAQATDFNGIKMLKTGSGGTSSVAQVLEVIEEDNAFAAAASFLNAFTQYGSGQTLVITGIDGSGNTINSQIVVDSADTITSVMTWIDAQTSSMSVSWAAHDGMRITDDTDGASTMSLTFGGGGGYTFTEATAGADATAGSVKIHFGTGNNSAEDYYYATNQDMTQSGLGVDVLSIATQASAQAALELIDTAILSKDTARAHFGAVMNRLENTVSNLSVQAENIQAAESQISDADIAIEMTAFVNNQIKAQAAVAMLAQANMMPQMALTLLGG